MNLPSIPPSAASASVPVSATATATGRNQDKLEVMLQKWRKETREKIKEKGEKQYDFLNDPERLMLQIKDDSRNYVEDQWSIKSYISKSKNVLKQFYAHKNPFNKLLEEEPSFILKTRRV